MSKTHPKTAVMDEQKHMWQEKISLVNLGFEHSLKVSSHVFASSLGKVQSWRPDATSCSPWAVPLTRVLNLWKQTRITKHPYQGGLPIWWVVAAVAVEEVGVAVPAFSLPCFFPLCVLQIGRRAGREGGCCISDPAQSHFWEGGGTQNKWWSLGWNGEAEGWREVGGGARMKDNDPCPSAVKRQKL